ncbi:MAG: LrgB family protein [Clostridium sp.]|uniref:LrgB family protein n=1 Tax=Clostridium sp. TaxID=1506 RepID=UPI002A8D04DB|nr:LrgB family protein [Clostridium sp.]MDY5097911.1 LrgB family protein [Clostridium sp.]
MDAILNSPLFGIVLSILAFEIGLYINKKLKSPIFNPLLIAIALIILFLSVFHIPLESFNVGGSMISMFLAPATAVLAISIYNQFDILKKNFLPIMAGAFVGSLVSMGSVFFLSKMFGLDSVLTASLIPKSVTTPIAIEIASQLNGLVPVTVASVIITGILGSILAPVLIKIFKVKDPMAAGLAIGTCSHAVGTSKAIELGEVEGSMSGVAICIAGIMTVIISLFL